MDLGIEVILELFTTASFTEIFNSVRASEMELSDNAEDFLQVTQERLAKKGYAIR